MKIASRLICAPAAALLTFSVQAFAGTPLIVQVDQSQLMALAADPGSIIVGNPSIADVSVNGRQLFIHGHSFGETNLMVFDAGGKKIADYEITVSHDTENQLSLFTAAGLGAKRFSYTCAPNCEVSMMVGDANSYMENTLVDNKTKLGFATGTTATGGGVGAAAQ